ncbi:MAG: SUMF1/EgtB/PvdO family nonheme iron enzyme, partial [Desulfobacterales bacterium]|nr:SUMF1/EgtB/PvdO family nonheme iron enzyme [Desulfobacterales bacterium]
LNPQVLDNQKVVKKFFHEAMILAKLDHPGITRLLEFFPDGNNYAIVMEYVEGVELKKILQQQKGLLPFDIAMKIAKQVLDAFQYAMQNGILHRDIKPGNIMIDKHGNAKIMDFGIAKMSSTASHDTAASMLSVHYTAPERFDQSREVDARSDIYSLGLVLYEMFAGRRPFSATETSQIMFSHLNEIPDSPSKFVHSLPPTVSGAILKALEKDPEDRFQDFGEFSRALDAKGEDDPDATILTNDDITIIMDAAKEKSGAGSGIGRHAAGIKKHPLGLIAAAAGILLIFAAAGYVYLQPSTEVLPPSGDRVVSAAKTPDLSGSKNSKGFIEVEHPADGMPLVRIPSGKFTMGSDKYSAERPVQQIFLDEYSIDKHLVSNKQFSKFIEATGYVTDAEKEGAGMVRIGRRWKKVDEANWRMPEGLIGIEGKKNHPVSQVSYNDALQYCRWAGRQLPTEAQWEKAARGTDGNEYPWGDQEPDATMANFDNLVGTTTPVDRYENGQSPYGIFDMAGNVYQWTADWYATGERAAKNPTGPENGEERIIKGGSFIEGIESLRSANRDRYPPNFSSFLFGFRCAEIKSP